MLFSLNIHMLVYLNCKSPFPLLPSLNLSEGPFSQCGGLIQALLRTICMSIMSSLVSQIRAIGPLLVFSWVRKASPARCDKTWPSAFFLSEQMLTSLPRVLVLGDWSTVPFLGHFNDVGKSGSCLLFLNSSPICYADGFCLLLSWPSRMLALEVCVCSPHIPECWLSIGATLSLLFPSHQTCLGLSLIQLKWSPEDDIAFYHLNSNLALAVVGQIELLTSFCCTENGLCGFLQVSPTKYYKEYVIFLPVTWILA